jgi:leucyl aminopeptidase
MTKFKVELGQIEAEKSDLLILAAFEESFPKGKESKLTGALQTLNGQLQDDLKKLVKAESFEGKLGNLLVIHSMGKLPAKKVLVVGLGAKKDLKRLDQIRKVVASAVRRADSLKAETVSIAFFGSESKIAAPEIARAITEVSLLAPYKFNKYQTKKDKNDDKKFEEISSIKLVLPKDELDKKSLAQVQAAVGKGIAASEGVLLARELIVEPPNVVNPAYIAQVAQESVKAQKDPRLTLKVLGRTECEKLKMGAFLAVAQGSTNEPKFLHYHYKPNGKKARKHIAFVGKGITFDSGGLSLKPAKAMEKMKYDMAGSAAVVGLMSIITKINPDVEVTAIVAACENMPSGAAYRPGDVLTSMSGKTIEINNTDAEGRVTLADSVYYACQQKPDQVIDIATLTGAVVVALGEAAAGLMTNNDQVGQEVKNAFEEAGERLWELPLYDDYEDAVVKGTIADMLNAGSGGQAGSQNGGMFIKQFVGDTPWVHLDIAGTCWPERKDTNFTPKNNPAGFGVLGFIKHLENSSK